MRIAWSAMDLRTGRRREHDADSVFVSASLIKLPILLCALQRVDTGHLELTDQLQVSEQHRVGGSGWLTARRDLVSLDVAALLTAMIDSSDNCATNVIIEHLGLDAVNDVCRGLGLSHTVLRRAMMDTAAAAAGRENLTSAGDMTTLLESLAHGADLSAAAHRFATEALLGQRTTGRLDRRLPAGYRLAHKTGELPGIRHDAGIVHDDGGPRLVVSVLTQHGPDDETADAQIASVAAGLYTELGL